MKKIHEFFKGPCYVLIILAISLISWTCFEQRISLISFGVIAAFILFTNGPTEAIIPLIMHVLFTSRGYVSMNKIPIEYIIFGFLLLMAMIFYLIRYKVNLKGSKMKIGFAILAIASLLSLINLDAGNQPIRYFYSIGNVLFLLVYLFFAGTTKKCASKYISMCLVSLGVLLSYQLILTGLNNGSFDNKITNLGWGGANTVAIYLGMAIPSSLYLMTRSKSFFSGIFYFLLSCLFVGTILISQCRAGYVSLAVCAIPALIFTIVYMKKKKLLIFFFALVVVAVSVICTIFLEDIKRIIELTLRIGVDDNGRYVLWKDGIKLFLEHRFFGNGMFNINFNHVVDPNRLMVLHNTFIQCLYSFGLFGALGLIVHYVEKYFAIFKNFTVYKAFFLVITLSGFIHGMLDNTYFMVAYMLVLCPILGCVEHDDEDKIPVIKFWQYKEKEIS